MREILLTIKYHDTDFDNDKLAILTSGADEYNLEIWPENTYRVARVSLNGASSGTDFFETKEKAIEYMHSLPNAEVYAESG